RPVPSWLRQKRRCPKLRLNFPGPKQNSTQQNRGCLIAAGNSLKRQAITNTSQKSEPRKVFPLCSFREQKKSTKTRSLNTRERRRCSRARVIVSENFRRSRVQMFPKCGQLRQQCGKWKLTLRLPRSIHRRMDTSFLTNPTSHTASQWANPS